jgi:hypothetical protein
MSADPTIPDPFDGQSFNRYSYANNGPLSATDPSGYDSQNQLPPAYQSNPCQNECGGVPCYTCTGPGLVNDNGYPTPASEYASGTWNVTENFIDGSSSTQTYHTPAALFAALNGIEAINSDYGFGTTFQFELPGLTGSIVYAGNSIEVIDGGQSVTEYGAGLHSVDLEGDTNGGYNNGVYYPGYSPGGFQNVGWIVGTSQITAGIKTDIANARKLANTINSEYNLIPQPPTPSQSDMDLYAYYNDLLVNDYDFLQDYPQFNSGVFGPTLILTVQQTDFSLWQAANRANFANATVEPYPAENLFDDQ